MDLDKEEEYFRHLDERYAAYAAGLQAPLDRLALDRRMFVGGASSGRFKSLRELHGLVSLLPWLFRQAFPGLDERRYLAIAEAGVLLTLAALIYDNALDGQITDMSGSLILHHRLQIDALCRFHALIDTGSPFWDHYDRYQQEYVSALLCELYEHRGSVMSYSFQTMWQVGSGKAALLKTVLAALACAAQREDIIPAMDAAFDALAAALQLSDDVMDWRDDYLRGHYTLPLTQALPPSEWDAPSLSVDQVGRQFNGTVILETLLLQAQVWLREARAAAAHLACPEWDACVSSAAAIITSYHGVLVANKLNALMGEDDDD